LGYSHPITFNAPEGITFAVESVTRLGVQGIDKQLVGETAAKIRKLRKPEPYKGKGVRYAGEQVRKQVGKAGKRRWRSLCPTTSTPHRGPSRGCAARCAAARRSTAPPSVLA